MPSDSPTWPADTVFYQVFPDRFARSGRVPAPGPFEPWDAPPTQRGYKGGDLLGVVDRLDDLADLGIGGLYLNPVFEAASNHRYNASDYLRVDPLLGGDAALRALVDGAHERGIRVILDGVFNHSGRGFFPFQHVLEAGPASPYRDWFYLDEDVLSGRRWIAAYPPGEPGGHHDRAGFQAGWNIPSLPKLPVGPPPARGFRGGGDPPTAANAPGRPPAGARIPDDRRRALAPFGDRRLAPRRPRRHRGPDVLAGVPTPRSSRQSGRLPRGRDLE